MLSKQEEELNHSTAMVQAFHQTFLLFGGVIAFWVVVYIIVKIID